MVIVSLYKLKYFILLYPKQKKKSISLLFLPWSFVHFPHSVYFMLDSHLGTLADMAVQVNHDTSQGQEHIAALGRSCTSHHSSRWHKGVTSQNAAGALACTTDSFSWGVWIGKLQFLNQIGPQQVLCCQIHLSFWDFTSSRFLFRTTNFCLPKEMLFSSHSGKHCDCCCAVTAICHWLRAI